MSISSPPSAVQSECLEATPPSKAMVRGGIFHKSSLVAKSKFKDNGNVVLANWKL